MSNNKQSSVEWLVHRIKNQHLYSFMSLDELEKQAKEMHKEEIVNTWSEATSLDYEIGLLDASYILAQVHNAEQYYKETFGGNND